MNTMQEDLIARLKASAGIAALIDGEKRISWFERVRAAALPALVLTMISPGREWTHSGPDGLDGPRVQFDCWARTRPEAMALFRAVEAEMQSPAEVVRQGGGGTRFHEGFLELFQMLAEGEQDGGEAIYRISCDFQFYHEEI